MGDVIVLIVVVVVVAIVAHELAHVVATRAVGHEIFEIQIGGGPLWSFRVGTVDVRIGPVPIGGHVQTGARSADGFRWRSIVVAGSGVGANLILAAIGSITDIPLMAGFNLLAVVANLWPGRRRQLGDPSSDGRLLLDFVRNDADAIAEERSGWFCMRAMRARDAGDLDRARQLVDEGIDVAGETRALLAVAGVVAFEQRRFVDVVDAYAPLIDDPHVTVPARAGFAADAAWSASLSSDAELRALALPWATLARRVRPSNGHRRVVLALAQVDAGEPASALSTLGPLDDVTAAAVRALALAESGCRADARSIYFDDVVPRMDGDHPLLARVAAAVGLQDPPSD